MTKQKSGSKLKKALLTILIVLVALVALVFIGARIYFRAPVTSYYKASEKAFVIPGLMDGMVPQGFDIVEGEGIYLIGGYQKDHSSSRIYRVEKSSGKSNGYVVMGDENGQGIAPHAGGLAVYGDYLFVAGDEDTSVNVYRLSDVLNAESGAVLTKAYTFKTAINVAFLCFTDEGLIVGEFYRDPNYMTDESHWITGVSGVENRALAYFYAYDDGEGSLCGVSQIPSAIYSLPDLVQGMAIKDGKMWISQSYGTAKSVISCYDISDSASVVMNDKVPASEGVSTPVYVLGSNNMVSSFEAAPMAEEIIFVDGKLLIMCESASLKYFFGNLTGGRYCYATDVTKVG